MPGSTASVRSCTLHLSLFRGGVQRGDRSERGGACVGAQDRDVAKGKLFAKLVAVGRVGEIDGAHLDRHPILLGEPARQRPQHILAAGRDDQMVAARSELDGQRFADVLRRTSDDGTGVRAGSGYWHGRTIS
jgi:hypothetical protein